MRRSAAPSQVLGNVAKKPRFIPPGKSITVCLKNETKEMDQDTILKQINEKEGSASLLSKIHGQNQNANSMQSVESTERVKPTKSCFSISKCSKMEMQTPNTPKAEAKSMAISLVPLFWIQKVVLVDPDNGCVEVRAPLTWFLGLKYIVHQ